jgi:D-alanyl-D-alanine carboxypeptidase (penicillin-binding protein 5/6)
MLGVDGYNGVKTGITDAAGPCLASCYQKGDKNFIIVLLSSKSMEDRWLEVPKLVEWASQKKQA